MRATSGAGSGRTSTLPPCRRASQPPAVTIAAARALSLVSIAVKEDSSCRATSAASVPWNTMRAAMDDPDVSHQLLDLREDVAGDQHRHAVLAVQPPEQVADLEDAVRIEAVGRFVEDEQRRLVQQRDRDAQALLHAERELIGALAAGARESDQCQDLVDAPRPDSGTRSARSRDSRAR